MKKIILIVCMMFSAGVAFSETLQVNKGKSSVEWKATKSLGSGHNGSVALKSGSLESDGKTITGGEFIIDMTSIKNADLPADSKDNAKLTNHLKSDDFFSVEKNPEAKFLIKQITPGTGADNYKVSGDLTIKGITNSIGFPATIKKTAKTTSVAATISVDRTKWDVRYGSKNFFPDLVANKIINNEFEVKVSLTTDAPAGNAKHKTKK